MEWKQFMGQIGVMHAMVKLHSILQTISLFQIESFTAVPLKQNPFSHLDNSATVCTERDDRAG